MGCPCYTPDHVVNINTSKNQTHPFLAFPDELLVLILGFLSLSAFFAFSTTCKRLYEIATDPCFAHHHLHRRKQKQYLNATSAEQVQRINAVCAIIDEVAARAPDFVHDLHTCYNESINASRTKDLPKDTSFPSTYEGRATLSQLRFNVGPGEARASTWRKLELPINHLQEKQWHSENKRAIADKKRHASKEFKVHKQVRAKKQKLQHEAERRASQKNKDHYNSAQQKTTASGKQVYILP